MWVDAHCHLPVDGADDLVAAAVAAGVSAMVNVGCTLGGSVDAIAVAARFDGVWATVGVHPHDATDGTDGLAALATSSDKVVAIGECGLDHHYMYSPAEAQRETFAAQIRVAQALDLALVIHTREAWDETFAILEAEGVPERTVFHCFTGGPTEAERGLALGAFLSFSGIVTFPSAGDLRDAARLCPIDRLLVETDSPYLAPVPHRGRPNRPELVTVVGAAVAAARDQDVAEVAAATTANAARLYRFPVTAGPGSAGES